jgi:hypothetical protein
MAPSHQGARHRFRLFAAGVDSFSDQQTRADSHYDNQSLTRGELNSPGLHAEYLPDFRCGKLEYRPCGNPTGEEIKIKGRGFAETKRVSFINQYYLPPKDGVANPDGSYFNTLEREAEFRVFRGAATADLNGDGVSDLAVILTPPDAGANQVLVLLNDGTGKFGAPTTVAIPANQAVS